MIWKICRKSIVLFNAVKVKKHNKVRVWRGPYFFYIYINHIA